MLYIYATILVTIAVASAAAFFSVYGLAHIFSGALVAVIIMGSTMEAGKLLTTLILHQYWDRLSVLLRMYLTTAVVLLMLVTSGGIYGFLSAAYQKDQVPLQQLNAKIELIDVEYKRKSERLNQMNNTTASIGANYISARVKEKEFDKIERDSLTIRINQLELQKLDLAGKKIDTEAHIGPIIYMAEVFDSSAGQAANFLIMLLIVVFDPLAIALTITVSSMIRIRKEDADVEEEPVDEYLNRPIKSEFNQSEILVKPTMAITIEPSVYGDFDVDPLVFTKIAAVDESVESIVKRLLASQDKPEAIDVDALVQRIVTAQIAPEPIIIEKEVPVTVEKVITVPVPSTRSDIMKQVRENSSK